MVTLVTDGACSKGSGGWACVVSESDGQEVLWGWEPDTTNNRMELQAVISGFWHVVHTHESPPVVTIVSDSEYIVNALMKNWLANWLRRGWKTAAHQPVKNVDLWKELLELSEAFDTLWQHVRGHNGHLANELADEFAVLARETHTSGRKVLLPIAS